MIGAGIGAAIQQIRTPRPSFWRRLVRRLGWRA